MGPEVRVATAACALTAVALELVAGHICHDGPLSDSDNGPQARAVVRPSPRRTTTGQRLGAQLEEIISCFRWKRPTWIPARDLEPQGGPCLLPNGGVATPEGWTERVTRGQPPATQHCSMDDTTAPRLCPGTRLGRPGRGGLAEQKDNCRYSGTWAGHMFTEGALAVPRCLSCAQRGPEAAISEH